MIEKYGLDIKFSEMKKVYQIIKQISKLPDIYKEKRSLSEEESETIFDKLNIGENGAQRMYDVIDTIDTYFGIEILSRSGFSKDKRPCMYAHLFTFADDFANKFNLKIHPIDAMGKALYEISKEVRIPSTISIGVENTKRMVSAELMYT
jgi:hypothetical protein